MKCVVCHGDDIQMATVKDELRIGNDIVYVPVNILVCDTCGERYYNRHTIRYLEEIERKLLEEGSAHLPEVGKLLEYG